MTLYRQLVSVVILLFILMFMEAVVVNFRSTQVFLVEQLESHAQDTATSLGLSLSPHMQEKDHATMVSMVDAIFDRGYYKEILVETTDGKPLIERKLDVVIEGVPAWFVGMIKLDLPRAHALVMSGWNQAGVVYVDSHPGYAYNKLWQSTVQMLITFLFSATIVTIIGAFLLRMLLKPLKAVERQANALCARRYEIQEKLPRTREMRSVVTAMNRMTIKVKAMFDEQARSAVRLKAQAFQDPVTNLANRRYFDIQLQARLKSPEEFHNGILLLVQLNNLHELNDRRGFEAGDELLKKTAAVLETASADIPNTVVGRLGGGDFALLLPEIILEEAEKLATEICNELAQLHTRGLTDTENVANVGIALYVDGIDYKEFLSNADMALRSAQSKGANVWSRHEASELTGVYGRHEWKEVIDEVVRTKHVVLYHQPVVDVKDPARILHNEIFVRIRDKNNNLLPAAVIMPMAEEIGVARELDWTILNEVITRLEKSSEDTQYAINLSPASLQVPAFVEKMLKRLAEVSPLATKLMFEFADCGVAREPEGFRHFAKGLRRLGFGIGIDHFGRGFCSFSQLQTLRPDYVKIDGAYSSKVAEDLDNQFFVETLCGVAHSLDILAIAEAVEDQAQWDILKELHVDGIQGFVVGQPAPLNGQDK